MDPNVCVQAEMAAALVKGLEDQESELIERVRQAQVSLSSLKFLFIEE